MAALTVAKRFTTQDGSTAFKNRGSGSVVNAYQPGATNQKFYGIFEYDFARDGALAVGHNAFGWVIPVGSIITDVFVDIKTQIAGPTAVKCGVLSSGDLVSTGIEGTAGLLDATPEPGTESGYVRTTSTNTEIMLEATVAASSAGKVVVYVGYLPGTSA